MDKHEVTANITATHDGLVTASVHVNGEEVGDVTLLEVADGQLAAWGDGLDCWASSEMQRWLIEADNNRLNGWGLSDWIEEVESAATEAARRA